jgi:hypothetical protein
MRMKPAPRKKSARAKKPAPRISRKVGAAAVGATFVVFLGAAAMMSARTPTPTPAKPIAKIETPSADMSLDPLPAEAPRAQASPASAVTIVGCLGRQDDAYRLTDTTGDAAPKARSWKSGFIHKKPAAVDLVGAPKAVKLPTYVGQRVSVTGTLADRELQVRSVRRVAASCTN